MRAALGAGLMGNEAAIETAIRNSEAAYVKYATLRNEAEIDDITPKLNRPPPQSTPQTLAQSYVDLVLQPAIEAQENITSADASELRQWADNVKAAIIAYENIEVTPEALAAHLRKLNYPEKFIEIFLQRANSHRAPLLQEYQAVQDAYDRTRGIEPLGTRPNKELEVERMKWIADPKTVANLERLNFNRELLWRVKLQPWQNYIAMKEGLVAHPEPTTDWCTGQALKIKAAAAGVAVPDAPAGVPQPPTGSGQVAAVAPSVHAADQGDDPGGADSSPPRPGLRNSPSNTAASGSG